MQILKTIALPILVVIFTQILIIIYLGWNRKRWAKVGKRRAATQWRRALRAGETVLLSSYGQLDESQLSAASRFFGDEIPFYLFALTDFERFIIAPYQPWPFIYMLRKFKSYDRLSVSIDEIVAEEPEFFMMMCDNNDSFYSVTLVLPDSRIRLNHVSGCIVEALRR